MKKPRRITKFTVETERTFIFRNLGQPRKLWCEGCGAEVLMTSVADAARDTGLSELAIYQRLNAGELHFSEHAEGPVLICLKSLMK